MQQSTIDFSKMRILIVENHALMRRLLHEMLRGFGCQQIELARNVPEGLKHIYAEAFDMVILDFFLGDLDGADFARQVRHDDSCRNRWVPILLITGKPDHHKVLKVRDAGIHGMMAKPISPKDLYWRLHALLSNPRPFVVSANYIGPMRQRSQFSSSPPGPYRHAAAAPLPEIHHHRTAVGADEQIFN